MFIQWFELSGHKTKALSNHALPPLFLFFFPKLHIGGDDEGDGWTAALIPRGAEGTVGHLPH